jgi:hypothetical protein
MPSVGSHRSECGQAKEMFDGYGPSTWLCVRYAFDRGTTDTQNLGGGGRLRLARLVFKSLGHTGLQGGVAFDLVLIVKQLWGSCQRGDRFN